MKKRVLVSVYKLLQKIVNSFGWQFELSKLSRKGPIGGISLFLKLDYLCI
jgi:hypothetical protein